MDGVADGDGPTTRSAKRRRVSPPPLSPGTRSSSPDELAPSSPPNERVNPTLHPRPITRTPSYSPFSIPPEGDDEEEEAGEQPPLPPEDERETREFTPDELDHTAAHTFYRDPYRNSFSAQARQSHGHLRVPSRSPSRGPAYSIATGTPPPVEEIKEVKYVPYREKMVLKGHKRGVAAVRFSPDGRMIASCSADATIRIWDSTSGKCLHILEGHLAGISTIAWSPDSKTLASGSDDKSIRLWDVATGKPQPHPLLGHHHYIYSLAFSPKGNILVSGSYDEAVFLWDIRTRKPLRTLPAHSDPVGGVDFIRDGTLIVSCAGDGLIRIWDTGTGQCLRTLVHEDNAAVSSVRFSPNGKYVLAWTLDSSVRLWDYVEGRCVKTYQGHENQRFSIGGAFGTYGEGRKAFVVSGSDGGGWVVWDVVSKEVLQREGGEGVVLGVDTWGGRMVSAGIERVVRVWEVGGQEVGEGGEVAEGETKTQVVESGVAGEEEHEQITDDVVDMMDELLGDTGGAPNGFAEPSSLLTNGISHTDGAMNLQHETQNLAARIPLRHAV